MIDAKFVDEFLYPHLETRDGRQFQKLEDVDIPLLWSCLNQAHSTKFSERLPVTQCLEFGKIAPFVVQNFSKVLLQGYIKHADKFADIWAKSDPGLTVTNVGERPAIVKRATGGITVCQVIRLQVRKEECNV